MKRIFGLLTGIVLASVTWTAQAAVKYTATRSGQIIVTNETIVLPLNNLGATLVTFQLPAAKKLLLTFTVACGIDNVDAAGGVDGLMRSYIYIDVIVNGSTVEPTVGAQDPFCHSDHSIGLDHYEFKTIAMAISGKKGANTVQIGAGRVGQSRFMSFLNSALVISD